MLNFGARTNNLFHRIVLYNSSLVFSPHPKESYVYFREVLLKAKSMRFVLRLLRQCQRHSQSTLISERGMQHFSIVRSLLNGFDSSARIRVALFTRNSIFMHSFVTYAGSVHSMFFFPKPMTIYFSCDVSL